MPRISNLEAFSFGAREELQLRLQLITVETSDLHGECALTDRFACLSGQLSLLGEQMSPHSSEVSEEDWS